ncbi:MAG: glucose 1-dehydrogenase [Deltaproteobacteria bacterium]|nr:MAG: glucose 1-dehydrogenase [Deltaproteobacteria bacterium]
MTEAQVSFRLDGKVALVTGAARGIGASCAMALARAGARVLATDILEEEGRDTVEAIRRDGCEAAFERLDAASEESWAAGVKAVLERFGGFDILVNNAGVEIVRPILETRFEDWRALHSVNLDGVFLGMKSAVTAMKPGGAASRGGSIINLSSIAGLIGFPFMSAYCSSKGGVRNLSKAVAVECAKLGYGIRVNSVHPGFIGTTRMAERFFASVAAHFFDGDREKAIEYCRELTPAGHIGKPLDIAAVVQFLSSDASGFITGTELTVDGGFTAV